MEMLMELLMELLMEHDSSCKWDEVRRSLIANMSAILGGNVDDQRPSHFISLATAPSCSINNSAKNGRVTIKDLL